MHRTDGQTLLARASVAALCLCGCAAHGGREARSADFELSSPDVGYAWHLHARGGELLCVLPCEQRIEEGSGAYLAVHDPNKSWRIDLPSTLPGPPGTRVAMEVHVGKGSAAMEMVGLVLGIAGAAAAAVGIGFLVAGYFSAIGASTTGSAGQSAGLERLGEGGILIGAGALVGVPGFWLTENNRAPSVRVRLMPNGLAGTF